jgi:hypothetical protein
MTATSYTYFATLAELQTALIARLDTCAPVYPDVFSHSGGATFAVAFEVWHGDHWEILRLNAMSEEGVHFRASHAMNHARDMFIAAGAAT